MKFVFATEQNRTGQDRINVCSQVSSSRHNSSRHNTPHHTTPQHITCHDNTTHHTTLYNTPHHNTTQIDSQFGYISYFLPKLHYNIIILVILIVTIIMLPRYDMMHQQAFRAVLNSRMKACRFLMSRLMREMRSNETVEPRDTAVSSKRPS